MAIEQAPQGPPSGADAELRKGMEFTARRRWSEGVASFRRAQSLQPNRPENWDGLGVVAYETGATWRPSTSFAGRLSSIGIKLSTTII